MCNGFVSNVTVSTVTVRRSAINPHPRARLATGRGFNERHNMHRMKYTHYDDSNLLDITYDLTIEFGISKDEPPYDIRIVAATVTAGNADPVRITNPFDLATINRMLDPSFWKGNESVWLTSRRFVDDVEIAIAEHLNELDQAAKELAAEAKFQAERDGE